jgi:hypothetical protein
MTLRAIRVNDSDGQIQSPQKINIVESGTSTTLATYVAIASYLNVYSSMARICLVVLVLIVMVVIGCTTNTQPKSPYCQGSTAAQKAPAV